MSAARRRERIDDHIFVSLGPTEFQAEALAIIAESIRSLAGGEDEILTEPLLDLGRAELQPDFAVIGEGEVPRLVVEVQRESTDRYALGVKRMAYGRAGIAEYWFADPVHGRLVAMKLEPGEPDYTWPPQELHHGDRVPAGGFGAGTEVSSLLPPLVERYQATSAKP